MHDEIVNWKRAAIILQDHDMPDIASSRKILSCGETNMHVKIAESKKLRWTATQYSVKPADYMPNQNEFTPMENFVSKE